MVSPQLGRAFGKTCIQVLQLEVLRLTALVVFAPETSLLEAPSVRWLNAPFLSVASQ